MLGQVHVKMSHTLEVAESPPELVTVTPSVAVEAEPPDGAVELCVTVTTGGAGYCVPAGVY